MALHAQPDMRFSMTAMDSLPARIGRPRKTNGRAGVRRLKRLVNLPENYLDELRAIAESHNTSLSGAVMLLLQERKVAR